jgi:hypothetical protein
VVRRLAALAKIMSNGRAVHDDGIERVEVAGFDLRELKAALQHLTAPQQRAVLREVRELCGPTFH